MREDRRVEIKLNPKLVSYLETLLDRIRIKSGYGCVSIHVKDGVIHTVECTVSEVYNDTT